MTTVTVQPPYAVVICEIVRDADWLDPLPDFFTGDEDTGEVPLDLNDKTIEIYIRPTYDHDTLIKKLSYLSGEIVIEDAIGGLASINVPRGVVIADIPVGVWDWFCVLTDDLTGQIFELFRGKLKVHAGSIVE